MQINVGDIIVIEAQNDHGVVESINKGYTYIYWNDGVVRSIDNSILMDLVFQNRWKHYAI
jgi:hypothetical protein